MIQRYRERISGPLLDRIDLHVDVTLVDYRALSSTAAEESSEEPFANKSNGCARCRQSGSEA